VLLVVVWSAFNVLLDTGVGIDFLVTVIVQYVIVACDGVVRGDDALECAISGNVLAYFGVD
jgi:hypothetical protein